jgi:hypothetical protein
LANKRAYLAGAMDRVKDRGKGWRLEITPFLQSLGIIVFNPLKKPINIGKEDDETHALKQQLKKEGKYDELSKIMKTIRKVDLRLVDISDFLIVNIDLDHYAVGTWEECFSANSTKKAILVHMEQGKENAPDWLFGTIPHEMIFSTWDELRSYLLHINSSVIIDDFDRWRFLDMSIS